MPADRGRYPSPAMALPSPLAGCLVPGLPLPQARRRGRSRHRPASDSMPAGSPLTQARRIAADSCLLAAAIPSPVDLVHLLRPGVPFLSHVVPTGNILIKSCLVMSMETRLGQAAPLVVAMEAILAACPLVADMEAVAEGPCEGLWLIVMPRRSLSLRASSGGLPVPVGCPVLSVWPWSLVLSCCVFSPGGLLIPPNFPREILGGGKRVPAVGAGPRGPRPRPRRPSAMASWAPSSTMASWAPCTAMATRAPSSAMVPVCLFRSGGPRPVFLSVFVLRGLQSAHPPLPGGTVTAWDTPSGRGELCQVLLCVSSVPTSCVHIWFVSCPCFMSLWVKYVPAVFVSLCVNYPLYISPVFWVWFLLVYSVLPVFLSMSALPCPALPCLSRLKTIIWVYILVCVFLFLPRVCTMTVIHIAGHCKINFLLYILHCLYIIFISITFFMHVV